MNLILLTTIGSKSSEERQLYFAVPTATTQQLSNRARRPADVSNKFGDVLTGEVVVIVLCPEEIVSCSATTMTVTGERYLYLWHAIPTDPP
jgi:hypothetical protein